jgi:hypothetical protein
MLFCSSCSETKMQLFIPDRDDEKLIRDLVGKALYLGKWPSLDSMRCDSCDSALGMRWDYPRKAFGVER